MEAVNILFYFTHKSNSLKLQQRVLQSHSFQRFWEHNLKLIKVEVWFYHTIRYRIRRKPFALDPNEQWNTKATSNIYKWKVDPFQSCDGTTFLYRNREKRKKNLYSTSFWLHYLWFWRKLIGNIIYSSTSTGQLLARRYSDVAWRLSIERNLWFVTIL